jgi:hypothetical protein
LRTLLVIGIGPALLAGACGGSSDDQGVGGPLPQCAKKFPPVEAPSQLPKALPLPPGIVLTLARYDDPGRFSLSGVAPGDVEGVAGFFEDELPERGFRVGRGDQEPGEKEAPFSGRGYRGAWRVNAIRDCPAVTVGVILVRQR